MKLKIRIMPVVCFLAIVQTAVVGQDLLSTPDDVLRRLPERQSTSEQFGTSALKATDPVLQQQSAINPDQVLPRPLPDAQPANQCNSIDLRPFLPNPGYQEGNSCMAWALAYATYSCQICQQREHENPSAAYDVFSPSFIYNQLGDDGKGLYPVDAINFVMHHGCASTATMPLTDAIPSDDAMAEAQAYRAINHFRVDSLDDIKSFLLEGYPVIMVIQLDDEFKDRTPDETAYRWSGKTGSGLHAIAAVGFDDCAGESGEVTIMNSMGTDWKDGGFCRAAYSELNQIGSENWCTEAHVVSIKRSSPIRERLGSLFNRKRFGGSRGREFFLGVDHHVYEDTSDGPTMVSLIDSRGGDRWQIQDIASTEDHLFVLHGDHTISMLGEQNDGSKPSWLPLNHGWIQGKTITMMAATHGSHLYVLTSEHQVYEYDQSESKFGTWHETSFSADFNEPVIDLRESSDALYVTSQKGTTFVQEMYFDWERVEVTNTSQSLR